MINRLKVENRLRVHRLRMKISKQRLIDSINGHPMFDFDSIVGKSEFTLLDFFKI